MLPGQVITDKRVQLNGKTTATQNFYERLSNWQLKQELNLQQLIPEIVKLMMAFFLSRMSFGSELIPVGAAFFIINQSTKLNKNLFIWIGIFGGIYSIKGLWFAVGYLGGLVVVYLLGCLREKIRGKQQPRVKTFAWIGWSVSRSCMGYLLHQDFWLVLLEIGLAFLLGSVFEDTRRVLANPLKSEARFPKVSILLTLTMIMGGTVGIGYYSLNLMMIAMMFLMLLASYLGTEGAGAMWGIGIAAFLKLYGEDFTHFAALFGMIGLLGGLFKKYGKWGAIAGTFLGMGLALFEERFPTTIANHYLSWGSGMVLFMLTPKNLLVSLAGYLAPLSVTNELFEDRQHLRELILAKLNDLGELFMELAQSFRTADSAEIPLKIDLYALLDQVSIKNCQQCSAYQQCWNENFYNTYREIFELISIAEFYGEVTEQQVKGRLAKNCFQQYKLVASINHLLEKHQMEFSWQRKFFESKIFLTKQLEGIATIIKNLATEINTDIMFKQEVEDNLRLCFSKIGLYSKSVTVTTFGTEKMLEIKVKQRACNRQRECRCLTSSMVGAMLGKDYKVWERQCQLEEGFCSYSLTPAPKYTVKTSVCKASKAGNEFSGDSHVLREMKDGHFIAILSDGMGQGSKAAAESNLAVNTLERLLEFGIDQDLAVKTVNSVLLIHSSEELFATIDLVVIDLHHAWAEFVKIGSVSTYIKRGDEVWSINSATLPVGILSAVEAERSSLDLQPNDLLVMVSDGVTESKPIIPGRADWLIEALSQMEVVGPEALGKYLLNLAISFQGLEPKDDLTIIVLQIQVR